MSESESSLFEGAYRSYWSVVEARTVGSPSPYMRYDDFKSVGAKGFQYGYLEPTFTRELLNTLNQFVTALHRLAIWEAVLARFSDEEKRDLRFEFTLPLLYYALHQPAEYRARITFCSVQLSSYAALERNLLATSDFKDDHAITFKDLAKHAPMWKSGPALLNAVRKIDDAGNRAATRHFRNRRQHQVAPGLDFGLIATVTREKADNGRIAFSFGVASPLSTAEMLPLLAQQLERMKDAFAAYWNLVKEQTA